MNSSPSAENGFGRLGLGRRVAVAVVLAVVLALVLQVVTSNGPDAVSGGIGGDYASFYAAGDIVLGGPPIDPKRLYDPETQFTAQEPVLSSERDGNLFFAYPAFFVAPYVALAALEFSVSYLLHTALMFAAAAAALTLLRPVSRLLQDHPLETFAAALTFFPLFRGLTGGQNTALSLLLVAVVWRGLHDGREVSAGVAAGLLLFKPPMALPFLGALILARRWRAVASSVGTAGVLYLLGALVTGPSWPAVWMDAVGYLDRVDTPFNVQNFVSIPGAAEAVFGIDSAAATAIGFGLAAVAVAVVSWAWWRDVGGLAARMGLTATGAIVISPHALYYDAGLVVLTAIVLVDRFPAFRRWLPLMWALGFTHLAADMLGVSPLVLLVVGIFVTAWVAVYSTKGAAGARTTTGASAAASSSLSGAQKT